MARILLNRIKISKKTTDALKRPRFEGLARNAANTRYQIARQIAIEDFNEHPITLELEDEFGRSKYISRGNLFSFFGFLRGSKPIEKLKLAFQAAFRFFPKPTFSQNKRNVIYEFRVKAPDLEDLYKKTPMPDNWSNRGWLQAIEESIGTFASYIWHSLAFRSKKESRSGQALQIENDKYTNDGVLGIPYISEILEKFRNKFSKK